MEWGRAKTILIISFLLLNALLGYQLWQSKLKVTDENSDIEAIAAEIMALLTKHEVYLDVAIPRDTPKMNEITVTNGRDGTYGSRIELLQPVLFRTLEPDSPIWKELGAEIPNLSDYELDSAHADDGVIVLHQMANGFPMFDVALKLYYLNQGIYSYRQDYVVVQEGQQQVDQRVLSAYLAVGRLAENYLRKNTVITDIQLGYHGQLFNSETLVLAPSWRISADDGSVYYVHAINGAVETPNKE